MLSIYLRRCLIHVISSSILFQQEPSKYWENTPNNRCYSLILCQDLYLYNTPYLYPDVILLWLALWYLFISHYTTLIVYEILCAIQIANKSIYSLVLVQFIVVYISNLFYTCFIHGPFVRAWLTPKKYLILTYYWTILNYYA